MKQIDTCGLSFQRLIEGDYYFVDKSMLIADILGRNSAGVHLFTRPRRFGKTTSITMLDAFFNIEYAGNTWFDSLEISEHHEYDVHRNAYPVVCLDLKDTDADSFEEYLEAFGEALLDAARPFYEMLEGSEGVPGDVRDMYGRIAGRTATSVDYTVFVANLCGVLEKRYGKKVVVLIDEYDRAVTSAFGKPFMGDIAQFLGRFLSKTLKSNRSLQLAYVTGITQIAKAGMSSGSDDIRVDDIFSMVSDERFGFTEAEVKDILCYYGHPEKFDEVRDWYDGYRFGQADVYNPFSVMSYMSTDLVPDEYWVNTSRVVPIRWMLRRVDMDSLGEIATIVNGGVAVCRLHPTMTYDELLLSKKDDLYSLMVMTGYLNAVPKGGDLFEVSIPNREVMSEVTRFLDENVTVDTGIFERFNDAITEGDADTVADVLGRILCDSSYYELRDEASYELIILTILHAIAGSYDIRAQKEAGNGRADLILAARRHGIPNIVIELKVSEDERSLDADVYRALEQIRSRRYYMGMEGDVILMGVAFFGKVPRARSEIIHL